MGDVEELQPAVPFLKMAGGKRQLLPSIREHVPARFGRYFEPFVGGGAVFFDLVASGRVDAGSHAAFLGDSNAELVVTYEGVRDEVDAVVKLLREHAAAHGETHYYAVRGRAEAVVARVAARMIYLNKTCFNGLYRVNRSGKFNVPMGRYMNPTICDEPNLRACSRALQAAEVVCADFASTVAPAREGDFCYFDSPYVPVSDTSDFTGYTHAGFAMADQVRLADCARGLKDRGVRVLLSNADLPVVRKLYAGFEMRRVEARRSVNSRGDKRGTVGELLIW